jgi:hypothetical protein
MKNLVFENNFQFYRKSTPDFIWLEWEKSNDVRLSDIECFKLMINGQTKAIFPPTENKFVVNDGELGERYIFQLEVRLSIRRYHIEYFFKDESKRWESNFITSD